MPDHIDPGDMTSGPIPVLSDSASSPPPPPPPPGGGKPLAAQSESWLMLLSFAGSIANGLSSSANRSVSLISFLIAAGAYAYCHSPLAAERPGWRTPAFAGAVVSIIGSIATALSEADLPGLPAGVTRTASIVSAGVISSGYTIWRYNVKKKGA